jgi:DnaD/phage-associated family protein
MSTKAFGGFKAGHGRAIAIPAQFFGEVLPQIDDLRELKVTLYAFYFLARQEGDWRSLTVSDLAGDQKLLESLGSTAEEANTALKAGLEQAVRRGTLLRVERVEEGETNSFYFANTPRGKAAAQAAERGLWDPGRQTRGPAMALEERPNVYGLYEQHIGPLTPMIAEVLRDAEQRYPQQWIEDALRIAVENNVRRWRYVEAILKSWQENGRDDSHRRDSEADRRRYIEGEFGKYIRH